MTDNPEGQETETIKELKQAKLDLENLKKENEKLKVDREPEQEEQEETESSEELKQMQKEIKQLQRKNLKMEKQGLLEKMEAINPELAKKHAKSDLTTLEIAYETAKDISPKFAVNKSNNDQSESEPKGHYYDRALGQWV